MTRNGTPILLSKIEEFIKQCFDSRQNTRNNIESRLHECFQNRFTNKLTVHVIYKEKKGFFRTQYIEKSFKLQIRNEENNSEPFIAAVELQINNGQYYTISKIAIVGKTDMNNQ